MPTSTPINPDPKARDFRGLPANLQHRAGAAGFTLIELMVVIFIVGLMAAVVVLTVPTGSREVRSDADRLALRIAAARDEAVLRSQPIALWVRPSGYGFERRDDGAWQPLEDRPFEPSNWRSGVTARVPAGGARIVFDSVGLPSEALAVAIQQGGTVRTVSVDAAGEVSVDE